MNHLVFICRCLPRGPRYLKEKVICDSKSNPSPPLTGRSPVMSGPNSPNFETDSYSDNYSLFSSCSDECSCSTDSSTRESNSADDLSDLIFGGSGRGLGYPWKSSSDSDTSSPSTSPLGSGHQPHMTSSGGIPFLCSDLSSTHCRNVDYSCSKNSNLRHQQPGTERLTGIDSVSYGVPSRRSTSAVRRG
uniref:Uncharacterized protein n=1 Tax=Kalanchoe fedtschenkoi TaxID=63787 RepID=A0A7N0URZ4_KALFE